MPDFDRRDFLTSAALATAASATTAMVTTEAAAQGAAPAALAPGFTPLPLPFNAASIAGFSERILTSHHDNNYVGAVNRIGAIQGQLRQLDMGTAPGFQISGLKREELLATNSMILHELYFASLGMSNQPGTRLARQIETDFGSHDQWRAEFVGMGEALGGGSGWVILNWSPRAGRLLNQWAADHTMTLADGAALVVLDMYEHAYHIDFGARAGDYVNAYMGALNWTNADRRFAQAQRDRG